MKIPIGLNVWESNRLKSEQHLRLKSGKTIFRVLRVNRIFLSLVFWHSSHAYAFCRIEIIVKTITPSLPHAHAHHHTVNCEAIRWLFSMQNYIWLLTGGFSGRSIAGHIYLCIISGKCSSVSNGIHAKGEWVRGGGGNRYAVMQSKMAFTWALTYRLRGYNGISTLFLLGWNSFCDSHLPCFWWDSGVICVCYFG